MQGFEKIYVGSLFSGYLKGGVLGAWMTFKKAEMAKTLKNGLIMIEMNPLNHIWSHFVILSGLTLHQFQKKLLLRAVLLTHQLDLKKLLVNSFTFKYLEPNSLS